MSTATITRARPERRVTPEVRRPDRSRPSARGPLARPARVVPAPGGYAGSRPTVRSCRVGTTSTAAPWRLTDRGIALVLVLALMITVAAVVVIGLTAWRVTGTDYAAGPDQATGAAAAITR